METKKVLCLLNDGVEETELVAPVDILRRAGVEVTIAAMKQLTVTGKEGLKISGDALIGDLDTADFDCLMIPGGPAVMELVEDGRAAKIAKEFADAGKTVAAICAAPLILDQAGLLEGKRFTCYSSVREDLTAALDEKVVIDGELITSCGPGTALDFGFAVAQHLCGKAKTTQIIEEMMA
ncbi:MAG: DJ-1/PfpI family protein [Akkermansiaceae bacterium]|nr:DJ-1/PfpI family protein [Akkermansiaceae bacterium]